MQYCPRYVVFGDGDPCPAPYLKAFVYANAEREDGPHVFWQSREVILSLGLDAATPPHLWFKRHGAFPDLADVLDRYGAAERDLRPSLKAAKNSPGVNKEWLQPEQTMSTKVFLLHMLEWCRNLRQERKRNAALCLQGWLGKVVASADGRWPVEWTAAGDAQNCVSPQMCEGRSCCRHLRRILQQVGPEGLRAGEAADFLAQAWSQRHVCEDVQGWLRQVLCSVCDACDARLFDTECPFRRTAENLVAPRGQTKRRRLDKDLLVKGAFDMVKSKRFRSAASAAASGNIDASRPSTVDGEAAALARYVSSTKAVFAGAKQVTLCFDESTVSTEATLLAIGFEHRQQTAAHFPLQARGGDAQKSRAHCARSSGQA